MGVTEAPTCPKPARRVAYRDLVEYEVADDPSLGCFFVLGVRKSGSSLLNRMMHSAAGSNGILFVDIADPLFERGIHLDAWQKDAALRAVLAPGNLYGGFRNFPIGLTKSTIYKESRKVLMVRDPRDALVSEYFSDAYSHSIPAAGEDRGVMLARRAAALATQIDDYVLRMAPAFKLTLNEYRVATHDPRLLLLRYEDVIFNKRKLLLDVCTFFSWTLTEQQLGEILGWADECPEREDPTRFVRKVTPGDHREKLLGPTIARLDRILGGELEFYGYDRGASHRRSLRDWLTGLTQ